MNKSKIYPQLQSYISELSSIAIPAQRQEILTQIADYLKAKKAKGEKMQLNFICTHNSRRSQLSQVWAQLAAYYYDVDCNSFSGGVEVTAFNLRAVDSLSKAGFEISNNGKDNPIYKIQFAEDAKTIEAFSKLFDDNANPSENFAAIMTCSDADENCPFIAGAEKRIPLRYDDPKAFDDSPQENWAYANRSLQIASEMFYLFSLI